MTVIRRIMLGFAGLMVLVIAMVAVGVAQLSTLQSGIRDYSESTRAQVEAASAIKESAAVMESAVLISMVSYQKEARELQSARLEEGAAAARAALDSMQVLAAGNADTQTSVAGLRDLLDQYHQAAVNVIALSETKNAEALTLARQEVIPMSQEVSDATESLKVSVSAYDAAEADRLSKNAGLMWMIMLIVAAVVLVTGIVAAVTISRTIRRQLRAAAADINDSTSGLLAVSSQVSASAAQTASATNETTATVEEVRQTAQLAHEKASQVAESSQNVAEGADIGRVSTEQSITAFGGLADQMEVVAEAINRLSDQTQAVGDIISTVNDIAEQSNLLSVNASIEAAKAGDQGKGFTVVAQEVKSLAEQSKQAVAQVRTILGEIQKAGNVAVQAAEQGRAAIDTGRRQVEEARDRTFVLADDASEAAQSAAQISASSRQQLAGMEQISQAIESINQAGAQSAAGTRQVEQEVKRLQDLALRSKRLVDARATA